MPRKARIAAPGARRLNLSGVMLVPDAHGRVRVALADPLPCGDRDHSWAVLAREPGLTCYIKPAGDERGVFWLALPRRRDYWLEVAESLRGREVCVEATLRPYHAEGRVGVALDLVQLKARPVSAAGALLPPA